MSIDLNPKTIYDERFGQLIQETKDIVGKNNIQSSTPSTPESEQLSTNIVKVFVHLFSDGSPQNWQKLQKFLQYLVDEKVVFNDVTEQLEHYTYRLLFQLEFSSAEFLQKNFLADLRLKVHKIFPKFEFVKLLSADAFVDYEYKRQNRSNATTTNNLEDFQDSKLTSKVDAFNKYGGPEIYTPDEEKIREKLFKQKTGLLLRDFDKLIPIIALEIAAEETQNVWQLETIQNSLFGANLMSHNKQDTQRSTGRLMDMDLYKMPKEPAAFAGAKNKVIPPIGRPKVAPEYDLNSPSSGEIPGVAHAQHLMKANHLKIAKFVCLRPISADEPYNLEMVSKSHQKGEHYLMSNFGILRVHNDGFVESMSLAEFHREALIYKTLRKLKFFHQFQLRKNFLQWRRGANLNRMSSVRLFLEDRLLVSTPSFNVAFCHLHKLLIELETVGLVPIVQRADSITLDEFEDAVQTKGVFLQKVLKKFYDYSSIIVNTTRDKILERLELCEQKISNKPKPHVKASLSQQKVVSEDNQRRLLSARKEALQLGNFVQLFERYVAECLVAFTRRELKTFTKKMLELYSHKDDVAKDKVGIKPYLSIDLTFDLDCKPQVEPSIAQVSTSMTESITRVIRAITEITSPFGATVNPILDLAKGVKSRKGHANKAFTATSSQMGGSTATNLHRPSASLDRDLDNLSVMSRSQMSEALLNLSVGSGLEIVADGFIGQFDILTKTDLQDKLERDEIVQGILSDVTKIWEESSRAVLEYCEDTRWMVPICEFIRSVDGQSMEQIMSRELPEIQQMLNQTKSWIEQLETTMDLEWTSQNLLVKIKQDCVHVLMVPRLNQFIEQVSTELSAIAMGTCSELIGQASLITEFFSMPSSDMGVAVFAGYLSEVNHAKLQLNEAKPKLDHANSCLNTIKACVRALTEEEVGAMKDAELKLQIAQQHQLNAAEFVRKKRLEMEVMVRDEFQKKQEEVHELLKQSQTEQFTQLMENEEGELAQATANVKQLDSIRDKCLYAVKLGVAEAKYLEIIRGGDAPNSSRSIASTPKSQPILSHQNSIQSSVGGRGGTIGGVNGSLLDAGVLWDMYKQVEARRDLWKFLQVADSMTLEWKHFQFRLLKTHKVRTKLTQWSEAIKDLKDYLPENDQILLAMLSKIDYMKDLLPVIEFIQEACNDRKTWRQAVQKATKKDEVIDLKTLNELIQYDLTGANLNLLQTT